MTQEQAEFAVNVLAGGGDDESDRKANELRANARSSPFYSIDKAEIQRATFARWLASYVAECAAQTEAHLV